MSLPTGAIIAIAACGGVGVLVVSGAVIFWIYWRRHKRQYEEEQSQWQGSPMGGNVDISQLESRALSTTKVRSKRWRLTRWREKEQISPSSRESNDEKAAGRSKSLLSPIEDTALQGQQVNPAVHNDEELGLDETNDREPAEVYFPTGIPTRPPLTPISERDTPDSGRKILPRQGFHLPGNPKRWHYLTRSGRSSSPRCFSESSVASSSRKLGGKAHKQSAEAIEPNRPVMNRSLSFQSQSTGQFCGEELPLTPDAIYDACSRLTPSPIERLRKLAHARTGSETDAQNSSAKSSLFDENVNRVPASGHRNLIANSKPKSGKRNAQLENFEAELTKLRDSYRSPLESARSSDMLSREGRDFLAPKEEPQSPKRETSSGMSVSLLNNWHTPSKGKGQEKERHSEQHIESWHSHHPSEQAADKRYPSLHERNGQQASRKASMGGVLKESASVSNRQSHSMSPTPLAVPENAEMKPSSDEENQHRGKVSAPQSKKHKRSSLNRIYLQISRPNSVAASAILEDEVFDMANQQHSAMSPEVEVLPLRSSRPSSKEGPSSRGWSPPKFAPNFDFDDAIRYITDDSHEDQDSNQSALWSIIGDNQSNLSLANGQQLQASPPAYSDEELDDVLQLPLEKPETSALKVGSSSGSRRPLPFPSPPRSSGESSELEPIPPLRPRNSALGIGALPHPDPNLLFNSSPPNMPGHRHVQLIIDQPKRARSAGTPSGSRSTHRPRSQAKGHQRRRSQSSPTQRVNNSNQAGTLLAHSLTPSPKAQRRSRFRNTSDPPSEPLPPPPVPSRSQARMTSMMMQLRRQNSDSSRCDSSYFKLPQSQRTSQTSQQSGYNSHFIGSSSNRSSNQTISNGSRGRTGNMRAMRSDSLRSAPGSGRRGRQTGESDPFTENIQMEGYRVYAVSSRQAGFLSLNPSSDYKQSGRTDNPKKSPKQRSPYSSKDTTVGQAVRMEADNEQMFTVEQENNQAPCIMTDESERDLSPVGKKIMAEMRREHYDQQRGQHSPRSSIVLQQAQQQPFFLQANTQTRKHRDPQQERRQPVMSPTSATVRRHRRQMSSLSSVAVSSDGSGGTLSTGVSTATGGKRSRRESQRQRVETLKERVASMELGKKMRGPIAV